MNAVTLRIAVSVAALFALATNARAEDWGGATGNPPSTPGWKFEQSSQYYAAPLRCPEPEFFAYCRFGIGLHALAATDTTKQGGAGASLDFEKFVTDLLFKHASFAVTMGESLGLNSASGLLLDAWLGVGGGVRVGPVALVPLLTAGVDTVGIKDKIDPVTGAPAREYLVPFAFYGALGGRAIFAMRRLGLTANVARVFASGGRAETRVKLDLIFLAPRTMLSLSAYLTRYDDGSQAGIVIGFAFE